MDYLDAYYRTRHEVVELATKLILHLNMSLKKNLRSACIELRFGIRGRSGARGTTHTQSKRFTVAVLNRPKPTL